MELLEDKEDHIADINNSLTKEQLQTELETKIKSYFNEEKYPIEKLNDLNSFDENVNAKFNEIFSNLEFKSIFKKLIIYKINEKIHEFCFRKIENTHRLGEFQEDNIINYENDTKKFDEIVDEIYDDFKFRGIDNFLCEDILNNNIVILHKLNNFMTRIYQEIQNRTKNINIKYDNIVQFLEKIKDEYFSSKDKITNNVKDQLDYFKGKIIIENKYTHNYFNRYDIPMFKNIIYNIINNIVITTYIEIIDRLEGENKCDRFGSGTVTKLTPIFTMIIHISLMMGLFYCKSKHYKNFTIIYSYDLYFTGSLITTISYIVYIIQKFKSGCRSHSETILDVIGIIFIASKLKIILNGIEELNYAATKPANTVIKVGHKPTIQDAYTLQMYKCSTKMVKKCRYNHILQFIIFVILLIPVILSSVYYLLT